jgi:hypothetical protein
MVYEQIAVERRGDVALLVKMGLVPELASTHFLVQRMGFGRASEMCLSGRLYPAEKAHEKGLVDRLVPHEELLPAALALAGEVGANPAPQLRMIKQLLTRNGCATDLAEVQRAESDLLRACWKTPEHREGGARLPGEAAPALALASDRELQRGLASSSLHAERLRALRARRRPGSTSPRTRFPPGPGPRRRR